MYDLFELFLFAFVGFIGVWIEQYSYAIITVLVVVAVIFAFCFFSLALKGKRHDNTNVASK